MALIKFCFFAKNLTYGNAGGPFDDFTIALCTYCKLMYLDLYVIQLFDILSISFFFKSPWRNLLLDSSVLSNHFSEEIMQLRIFVIKCIRHFHSHIFLWILLTSKNGTIIKVLFHFFPLPSNVHSSSRYSCRIKGFSQIYCIVKEYARCDTLGINGVS